MNHAEKMERKRSAVKLLRSTLQRMTREAEEACNESKGYMDKVRARMALRMTIDRAHRVLNLTAHAEHARHP